LTLITEFSSEYRTLIEGHSENLSSAELSGGARIGFVFHEIFSGAIRDIDPFEQLSDADIRTILYNSAVPFLSDGLDIFQQNPNESLKGSFTFPLCEPPIF